MRLLVALLPKVNSTPPPTWVEPAGELPRTPDDENPLELARTRYARGDLTREEFEESTAALGHPGWSPKV